MPTIPRSQNHLAELLGIAKSICSRHVARGMPTGSVEAAQAWREANIDPARRKGIRFDRHYQPPAQQRQPTPPPGHTPAAQASALMAAASALLETGQSIDALVLALRAALRAVPPPERDRVELYFDVMLVLLADVLALRPADKMALCEDGSPVYLDRPYTDSEAQEIGEIWYQLAAGELLAT